MNVPKKKMILITFVFSKLRTPKTQSDKCLKSPGCFDKQYGKRAQTLLKSAKQHSYHVRQSLPSQLNWKKSLLLTCQIFRLLLNTLASDEKYPVLNRGNLRTPLQMELSEKQKNFLNCLLYFWTLSEILNVLKKRMNLTAFVFPKLRSLKMVLDKFLKSPLSEDAFTSNMVNAPKHCRSLHHSIFIIFIGHCQGNCVRKSLSYWHAKSWDCFLAHCLQMKSILFFIGTIYQHQFRGIILERKRFFSVFCSFFEI